MAPIERRNSRSEPFGYVCRRCGRCCHGHDIKINPYEAARLAHNLGQATAQFRAEWTRDGTGTVLKRTETGACVFFAEGKCTVYRDRPLVCRIYPLGRGMLNGSEYFYRIEEETPGGTFAGNGTIDDFLEAQGVAPFVEAWDEYWTWVFAAAGRLDANISSRPLADAAEAAILAADLIDLDAAVASYCAATGKTEPTDIEERKHRHLAFLRRKLDDEASMKGANGAKGTRRLLAAMSLITSLEIVNAAPTVESFSFSFSCVGDHVAHTTADPGEINPKAEDQS
jgi:Fe-S-cluster containining protein